MATQVRVVDPAHRKLSDLLDKQKEKDPGGAHTLQSVINGLIMKEHKRVFKGVGK